MNNEFEIMFSDLTEEAKQRFLDWAQEFGIEEANLEAFPIATVIYEEGSDYIL